MFRLRSLVVNSKTSVNRLALPATTICGNNFALHRKFCEKMTSKNSVNSIINEIKAGLNKLEKKMETFVRDAEKQNTSKPTTNSLLNANGIDDNFITMKKEMKDLRDGNDYLHSMLTQLQKNFNALRDSYNVLRKQMDEKEKNSPIEKLDQTKTANNNSIKTKMQIFRLSAAIFLCLTAYYVYVRLNSLQQMAESLQLETIISNFATRKNNKWNTKDCSPEMDISKDGLKLIHSGSEQFDNISARAAIPLPKLYPWLHKQEYIVGYFEAKMLHSFNPMIGFCEKEYPLEKAMIGSRKNSIGLWTQGMIEIDGHYVQIGNDASKKKFNSFEKGDVLGIGLICTRAGDRQILKCFATRNGSLIGTVNLPAHFHDLQLFPATSFSIRDTSIKANFGNEKWQFDPAQLLQ